jgi:hypothetical protein
LLLLALEILTQAKILDPINNGIDDMINLLDDMKLEDCEEEIVEEPNVAKLIENGELTPRFKQVLSEIFNQFDEGLKGRPHWKNEQSSN